MKYLALLLFFLLALDSSYSTHTEIKAHRGETVMDIMNGAFNDDSFFSEGPAKKKAKKAKKGKKGKKKTKSKYFFNN